VQQANQEAIEMKAKELDKEKQRLDCLNKAIKEKDIENQYNLARAAKEERLDDMKKNVAQTINIKRSRLKSKINSLKKLAANAIGSYDQQIMNIRLEMMSALNQKANYNPEKCKILINAASEELYIQSRKLYCDEKMANDPADHGACMKANREDIVFLCCDYETNPEDYEQFKKCMREVKPPKPSQNPDDIRFFWAKPYYRKSEDTQKARVMEQRQSASSFRSFSRSFSSSSSWSSSSSSSRSSSSSSSSSSSGSMGGIKM